MSQQFVQGADSLVKMKKTLKKKLSKNEVRSDNRSDKTLSSGRLAGGRLFAAFFSVLIR